ncbi:MAG TPA: hypothetical protein DEA96_14620 [Leptospiraceae bacterium]|nr:hypothetical protein [Spirochaetaceae bacterium]HBS06199.1 hypothetical protein [Leptospiraceae bacterium]
MRETSSPEENARGPGKNPDQKFQCSCAITRSRRRRRITKKAAQCGLFKVTGAIPVVYHLLDVGREGFEPS